MTTEKALLSKARQMRLEQQHKIDSYTEYYNDYEIGTLNGIDKIIEMYTKPKPVTQDMIDRFLNSGNTEGTEDSGASVDGSLEKITDTENECIILNCGKPRQYDSDMCSDCLRERGWALM